MSSKFFIVLFVLTVFTRFFGIDWGNGSFYNPDENNMARSLSELSISNLDPHFYAYGQLPVYLGLFILKVINIENSFPNSIYVLRFISAVSSCFAVLVFYKIIKKIDKRAASLATLLFIFIPGNIQLAHFGTTESILIFFYLVIFLISNKKPLIASIFLGLAIGIKISSAIFIIPILVSIITSKKYINIIKSLLIVTIFIFISSPYYFINYQEFISSIRYETSVATGNLHVFYTTQFQNTTPYIFQLQKIFPYAWGIPILVLFPIALVKYVKNKKLYILLCTSIIYFLYFGQVYTKWFRFSSPIFFIAPLFVGLLLSDTKNKYFSYLLTISCVIPGLIFMSRYFFLDQRSLANNYINEIYSKNIMSEGGNVVNLDNTYNFDFYNIENNPQAKIELQDYVNNSEYIIVPSRRVFSNQKGDKYPDSSQYYDSLFSGKNGFSLVKKYSYFPSWLSFEGAEETFTVFDNPTIRIFKRI